MTTLERPGPCAYCDHNPVMAERGLCRGVATAVGRRLYECVLFREWWDAGHAAGVAQERAANELQASIARINAVPWEPGT